MISDLELLSNFKKLCHLIFQYDIINQSPEYFKKIFLQFKAMYITLADKNRFNIFFNKLFSANIDVKAQDLIVELVVSYLITQKEPSVDITYEPNYIIDDKHHQPDLEINLNNVRFFVQIKRMGKSCSYNDGAKAVPSSLMVPIDDTKQLIGALNRAAGFIPPKHSDIFIILQLFDMKVPSKNIEVAEVLYGKEEHIVFDDSIVLTRKRVENNHYEQDGGFFYSKRGKSVDAYIKAFETYGFFSPYKFEMFINDQKESDKSPIYNILNIDNTYNSNTYFE